MDRYYAAIDLKSFYASVECAERGLDPLDTNLVVADESRTDKTICLAVSPSLKALGISGRARLFEAKSGLQRANEERQKRLAGQPFDGSSVLASELKANPHLKIGMITALPRMGLYMEYSKRIYETYLKHVAPEDIFAYSIDEVFIELTPYLKVKNMTPHEFTMHLIRDVLKETGITATAGIGTNMYLAKVAMDIEAKHAEADQDGVRIAELNERSYREKLWAHQPITDFWRIGRGTAKRLESCGIRTMGDIARCSLGKDSDFYNEDLLYRLFGVNAELLIDHAWGYEPALLADVKSFKPETKSLSSGQILPEAYPAPKGKLVVREMADLLSLDLVRKGFRTSLLVLDVNYDIANVKDTGAGKRFKGQAVRDYYGRSAPPPAHGSIRLSGYSSSSEEIIGAFSELYDRIVDPALLVRRFTVTAADLKEEESLEEMPELHQMSLFEDPEEKEKEARHREKERKVQETMLSIRERYGKNAILRGMNFEEGATARERNRQIGGHRE